MLGEITSPFQYVCVYVCACVLHVHVCVCVCEREEGSDLAASIKLSPWNKVAVSNKFVLFTKYIH